jgi:hypothetical protein
LASLASVVPWNTSGSFNHAVGELFVAVRSKLSPDCGLRLEEFLAAFCSGIWNESPFRPPLDDVVNDLGMLSSFPPEEVKRRLALWDWIVISEFTVAAHSHLLEHPSDVIGGILEVVEFLFMWAAAFGQAAAKDWGMIVWL